MKYRYMYTAFLSPPGSFDFHMQVTSPWESFQDMNACHVIFHGMFKCLGCNKGPDSRWTTGVFTIFLIMPSIALALTLRCTCI